MGLLIQTAVGSAGGRGGRRTKRSGRRGVGGVEDGAARGVGLLGVAVVDGGGVIRPIPEWRCWWLYQSKKSRQNARASSMRPKRSGKSGRYFSVLNCASENGLSFEVYGRLCVLVTPRSASRNATGLERHRLSRGRRGWSAGRGAICCCSSVSAISFSASGAVSRCCTVQPTT